MEALREIVEKLFLRKRVVLFERVLLTEACRGKGSTLFPSLKRLRHALFCCVCNCCVLWHVCIMYSRDEKVFTILALFTYDYENICMNR